MTLTLDDQGAGGVTIDWFSWLASLARNVWTRMRALKIFVFLVCESGLIRATGPSLSATLRWNWASASKGRNKRKTGVRPPDSTGKILKSLTGHWWGRGVPSSWRHSLGGKLPLCWVRGGFPVIFNRFPWIIVFN